MNETNQKSYVQYTSLFNKVCSGPIFLVLAALSSVYMVVSAISFFGTLGNLFAMFFPAINFVLSIISTIAFWMIFLGAKKGNIKPSFFKMATACAKFVRGIVSIITVGVTLASAATVALVFALKDTLIEMLDGMSNWITEIGDSILDKESAGAVETFFADLTDFVESKAILLCIGCIVLVVLFILSLIRFSKAIGFMKSVFETYTKGHMVAAPGMFFPIVSFIVAAFGLYLSFDGMDWMGIVYSLMIAVGGVLILLNKNELANIYKNWQAEMGMITADAAAASAPAAPATPAEEAPVAAEAPVAEEAPANDAE